MAKKESFRHTTWAPKMLTCRDCQGFFILLTMPRQNITAQNRTGSVRISLGWFCSLYPSVYLMCRTEADFPIFLLCISPDCLSQGLS